MLHMYREGIMIPLSTFNMIKGYNKFKVTYYGFQDKITTLRSYIIRDRVVYVAHEHAKHILPKLLNTSSDVQLHIPDGQPININMDNIKLKLRPHQSHICDWLIDHYYKPDIVNKGGGSCVMELKAGLGKTYIALYLMLIFKVKTLLVTSATLVKQWKSEISKWLPDIIIGEYTGTSKTDGHIILASQDSLKGDKFTYRGVNKKTYTIKASNWFNQFGYTIIDEIQNLPTKGRLILFNRIRSIRVLAMSATCNHRLNKMDKIYHMYLGYPVKMVELFDSVKRLVNMDHLLVNVEKIDYEGPPEYTKILCTEFGVSNPLMINQLAEDPYRNKMLIDETIKLYLEGHAVFLFLSRITLINDMVPKIQARLDMLPTTSNLNVLIAPECNILPDNGKTVYTVQGASSVDEKQYAKDHGEICLITYGCGSTGISFDRYTAMIIGHPRRNGFLQTNNRIFRLDGPKNKPRVLKFVADIKTPLATQYTGFKRAIKTEYPQATYNTKHICWDQYDS